MRIVVTGSRDWSDEDLLRRTLNNIHHNYGITVLYHGEARGADTLARMWCLDRGIPVFGCPYPPFYGPSGGPIRNGWLLDEGRPDLVVAFPLPDSRGTWNCIQQAKARGLNVRIVRDHL